MSEPRMPAQEPSWSVARWPVAWRVLLLFTAIAGLTFMLLKAQAFGLREPAFIEDLRGLPYLLAHLLIIGALLLAQGLFLLDVIANGRLTDVSRVIWGAALFVGNVIVMPIYWALYLSQSHRDERRSR